MLTHINLRPSLPFCVGIHEVLAGFCPSPVKMFLSSRQAGYSIGQQRQPRPEKKSDKCEVSGRYFVVGGQMAAAGTFRLGCCPCTICVIQY